MMTVTLPSGKTHVTVGIDGVPITWVEGSDGHDGGLGGDGSPRSRQLIKFAKQLADSPRLIDVPQLRHPSWTTLNSPEGALVTLCYLAQWRGDVLEAPLEAIAAVFVLATLDETGQPILDVEGDQE